MSTSGDAQAASGGLSEAQAMEAFEARLTQSEGDSEGEETQGEEQSDPEAEAFDEGGETPDDDAEEQSEHDDDEGDDEGQPRKFRVKVEDQEFEVTQDELIRGYQREKDYSRKTMALGEERKALDAEKSRTSEERAKYKDVLDIWAQQLRQPEESDADLEALRQTDPAEYAARVADQQMRERHLANVLAEKQRVEQAEKQEFAKTHQAILQEEKVKLLTAIPSWADPEKGAARAKADMTKMREYAVSVGFPPADVDNISDHRMMVVLREAAAYRALQAKKPQVQRQVEVVKTARPGTAASRPSRATEVERAKQRLKSSGSEKDAMDAFLKMDL